MNVYWISERMHECWYVNEWMLIEWMNVNEWMLIERININVWMLMKECRWTYEWMWCMNEWMNYN